MGAKKYVMTAARKAALRKAQEAAWAKNKMKGEFRRTAKKMESMTEKEILKKAVEGYKREQARIRPMRQSHKQAARQIAQRRMWEGSNYWGP
jgi:hypothetical protein